METDPVVPELDVPELKTSTPLTPLAPALAVRMVTAPLDVAMPWPLTIPTAPPVRTVLSPEATVSRPPAPLMPLPTVMLMAPPLPPVAESEPMETDPVVPLLDVPELKTSTPLTPVSPAFADLTVTAPLELAIPRPLVTPIAPPVRTVL
jgi:hypothetical protein